MILISRGACGHNQKVTDPRNGFGFCFRIPALYMQREAHDSCHYFECNNNLVTKERGHTKKTSTRVGNNDPVTAVATVYNPDLGMNEM